MWGVVLCFCISTRCKKGIVVLVQNTGMRKRKLELGGLQLVKWHGAEERGRQKDGTGVHSATSERAPGRRASGHLCIRSCVPAPGGRSDLRRVTAQRRNQYSETALIFQSQEGGGGRMTPPPPFRGGETEAGEGM